MFKGLNFLGRYVRSKKTRLECIQETKEHLSQKAEVEVTDKPAVEETVAAPVVEEPQIAQDEPAAFAEPVELVEPASAEPVVVEETPATDAVAEVTPVPEAVTENAPVAEVVETPAPKKRSRKAKA